MYAARWLIEMFHKTLKSGCRIETRQFETRATYCRYLAMAPRRATFDCIVAWRLLYLTLAVRVNPDCPCSTVLEDHEWRALYIATHHRAVPHGYIPSLTDAVLWIAKLGGYLGRKSDSPPGIIVLWRGLSRLNDIAFGLFSLEIVGKG